MAAATAAAMTDKARDFIRAIVQKMVYNKTKRPKNVSYGSLIYKFNKIFASHKPPPDNKSRRPKLKSFGLHV